MLVTNLKLVSFLSRRIFSDDTYNYLYILRPDDVRICDRVNGISEQSVDW